MKNRRFFLFIVILILILNFSSVSARAGGSSGGTGGSSSSSGHTSSHSSRGTSSVSNPISTILHFALFIVASSGTAIIVKYKITKAGIKTRRGFKKVKWDYKETRDRVIESYYVIQEAWANGSMESANEFMTKELYDRFVVKLNWMEIANKKNVMKKIKLLRATPIYLYDEDGDSKDYIWVYIVGKMVDYTINTETNEKIDGSTMSLPFTEFWFYKKNDKGEWILSKILQKDEFNNVPIE